METTTVSFVSYQSRNLRYSIENSRCVFDENRWSNLGIGDFFLKKNRLQREREERKSLFCAVTIVRKFYLMAPVYGHFIDIAITGISYFILDERKNQKRKSEHPMKIIKYPTAIKQSQFLMCSAWKNRQRERAAHPVLNYLRFHNPRFPTAIMILRFWFFPSFVPVFLSYSSATLVSLDRRTRLTLFPSVPHFFVIWLIIVLCFVMCVFQKVERERAAKKTLKNFDVKK